LSAGLTEGDGEGDVGGTAIAFGNGGIVDGNRGESSDGNLLSGGSSSSIFVGDGQSDSVTV
jgi:hypothetical protein